MLEENFPIVIVSILYCLSVTVILYRTKDLIYRNLLESLKETRLKATLLKNFMYKKFAISFLVGFLLTCSTVVTPDSVYRTLLQYTLFCIGYTVTYQSLKICRENALKIEIK